MPDTNPLQSLDVHFELTPRDLALQAERPDLRLVSDTVAEAERQRQLAVTSGLIIHIAEPQLGGETAKKMVTKNLMDLALWDVDERRGLAVAFSVIAGQEKPSPAEPRSSPVSQGPQGAENRSRAQDDVGQYLNEIGEFPLLTEKEEKLLAGLIRDGVAARQRLEVAPPRYRPSLRKQDLRAVATGEKAKETFIKSNLRLVVSIAKRYQNAVKGRMELLDLVQEGNIGLEHAVDLFDADKGFKFSTYATHWIWKYVSRSTHQQARVVRLPVHIEEDIVRLQRSENEALSDKAIMEEHQWSSEHLDDIRLQRHQHGGVSLDQLVGEDDSARLGDFVADPRSTTDYDLAEHAMGLEELAERLGDWLSPYQIELLFAKNGLGPTGEVMNNRQLAKLQGLSQETIRRRSEKVLRIIHAPQAQDSLRDFRHLFSR